MVTSHAAAVTANADSSALGSCWWRLSSKWHFSDCHCNVLFQGFLDLDQAMLEEVMLQEKVAGSTAVVVLVKDNTLYCANVGDSRAIASVRGAVSIFYLFHSLLRYNNTI
jgi:serine/threonine protein phosphatase PrpC